MTRNPVTVAPTRNKAPRRALFGLSAPSVERLCKLRALVLLSGSVRAKAWSAALGRPVLGLPLEPGRPLLADWTEQAAGLARLAAAGQPAGAGRLEVRVLVDRSSPAPEPDGISADAAAGRLIHLGVERDPLEYRGTGGLLRDVSRRYDEQDFLLVASGAQVLTESLASAASALAARGPDVALLAHDDGTPSGLMWIRCGCLTAIPEVGFVDMKEQALPQIARRHDVAVLRRAPIGLPVQTPAQYLAAVRAHHLRKQLVARFRGPFAEDWRPAFTLVEQGAQVDPSARIHDSVVLRGGRVQRRAVVVRSLVGPGGVVRRGERVVDQFLGRPGVVWPA